MVDTSDILRPRARWTPEGKRAVMRALAHRVVTEAEVMEALSMNADELDEWKRKYGPDREAAA